MRVPEIHINLTQTNTFCVWFIGFGTFKVNAERKSKVDDNTAKMQSIKWLGV